MNIRFNLSGNQYKGRLKNKIKKTIFGSVNKSFREIIHTQLLPRRFQMTYNENICTRKIKFIQKMSQSVFRERDCYSRNQKGKDYN